MAASIWNKEVNGRYRNIMGKLKTTLKWIVAAIAFVVIYIYYDKQDFQTRCLLTIIGLQVFQMWTAEQRAKERLKAKREQLYQVEYEKKIIAADSDRIIATLELKHTLPFIPFPGLSVVDIKFPLPEDAEESENHDAGEYWTDEITAVTYRYSRFYCNVKPHKISSANDILEVLEMYYEHEWRMWLDFDLKRLLIENLKKKIATIGDTDDEKALDKKWKLQATLKKVSNK